MTIHPMTMASDLKSKSKELKDEIDLAIKAGKEFCDVYYKRFQNARHTIDRLYHDKATMLYRGNVVKGSKEICTYVQELPMAHITIDTIDCHPVLKKFTNDRETLAVLVNGTVKYDGQRLNAFTQSFMIFNENQHWKILNDSIRLRDP